MAEKTEFLQAIDGAILDTDSLEQFINGSDSETVLTRLSAEYPTLQNAIKQMFVNGGLPATPYQKKSDVDTPSLSEGQYIYVTNDVPDLNGLYVYTSAKGLSRVSSTNYQAFVTRNIIDALPDALGFDVSPNIVDISKAEKGKYYNAINGNKETVALSYSNAVGLVPIKPATLYRFSNSYNQQFALFDVDKNYITGYATPNPDKTFTSPSNAYYIGLTIYDSNKDVFMLCEASKFPSEYVPYYKRLSKEVEVSTQSINNLDGHIEDVIGYNFINIADPSPEKVQVGKYVSYISGKVESVANSFCLLGPFKVKPSTSYRTRDGYIQQLAYFNKDGEHVGGFLSDGVPESKKVFTTTADTDYILVTEYSHQIGKVMIAEESKYPDEFVEFGAKIDNLVLPKKEHVHITVTPVEGDADADFAGSNAIQEALDSITDASKDKEYTIHVKQGLYHAKNSSEFLGFKGYPAVVDAKDWVNISGKGEQSTVIMGTLPPNDGDIDISANGQKLDRILHQTLWNRAGSLKISNMTFIAENLRYALHQDSERSVDKVRHYENVSFIHRGSKGLVRALGIGTFSGEENYVKGGRSYTDSRLPMACHNNVKFDKPSKWSFESHIFEGTSDTENGSILLNSCGSLVKDNFDLVNCSFKGSCFAIEASDLWLKGDTNQGYDSFDHADWSITGSGNTPFLYDSSALAGYVLKFETGTMGATSKVRFDTESSAFNVLVKNNRHIASSNFIGGVCDYINDYIVRDGSAGLSGYALTCLDIYSGKYLYDSVNYTSLANRLGDCTANPLSLGLTVDGVSQVINFNKNYSSMTNEQIIQEINNQLQGCTVAEYSYSQEYYPEIKDVMTRAYNGTENSIPKGSVVAFDSKGYLRLAEVDDVDIGVALEDIPVAKTDATTTVRGKLGRVLIKGYIYTDKNKPHFVNCDIDNPALNSRYKPINGVLVPDNSGKIFIKKNDGVIAINC